MARRKEDPMSGLLSNLSGIESSLFQKPQSMKDMRTTQPMPVQQSSLSAQNIPIQTASNKPSTSTYQSPGYQQQSGAAGKPNTVKSPSQSQVRGPGAESSGKDGNANSQLDALFGDGLFSRKPRPMREVGKPNTSTNGVTATAQATRNGVPPKQAPAEAVRSPTAAAVHGDLDAIFGQPAVASDPFASNTPAPGRSQPVGSSDPFAPAASASASRHTQPSSATDPFDLFGGLGTTQRQPKATKPEPQPEADLLGGFTGSLGVVDHAEVVSPKSLHSAASGMSGSDWGGMMGGGTPPLSSPVPTSPNPEDVFHSAGSGTYSSSPISPVPTPPRSSRQTAVPEQGCGQVSSSSDWRRPHGYGDPPPAGHTGVGSPPPSYDAVMRSSNSEGARRGGGSAATRNQIFDETDAGRDRRDQRPGRVPRRSTSAGRLPTRGSREQADRQSQADPGDMKDQAKQWLSAGQKWLSGAGKKVGQAVKEAQNTLNTKLEELEIKPASGGGAASGRQQSQGQAPRPRGRDSGQDSLEGVPPFYFEWAATIEALPGHEQGTTLAAMPDEDAAVIQRILRSNARRRSFEQTEAAIMEEAARRSRQNPQPSASRPLQPAPLSHESAPQVRQHVPERAGPPPPRFEDVVGSASPKMGRQRSSRSSLASFGESARDDIDRAHQEVSDRKPVPSAAQSRPLDDGSEDLMGLHSKPTKGPAGPPTPSSPQAVPGMQRQQPEPDAGGDDLMGLHGEPSSQPAGNAASPTSDILGGFAASPTAPHRAPSAGLDGIFTGSPRSQTTQRSAHVEDMFNAPPPPRPGAQSRRAPGGDSMIDFGDEVGVHEGLYAAGLVDEEQEGEPEARKIARRKRLAEMHARMQRQLAEKQARDQAEAEKHEAQAGMRTVHNARMDAWKSGKKENIRALLSTLHTVLWENSGWTAPGMTDLVEPTRVKRAYMKANLIVHPDKVKQKGGSVEQIVIADIAFDTLKGAWGKFEASELKR